MSRKGWIYIAHYRCGCIEEATRKKDLVGYCGQHGHDLLEPIISLPPRPEVITPNAGDRP
jgi:hypothetical protein